MNVHVHIERLILEGLPLTSSQASLVRAAVEAELGRLLTNGGLAPALQAGGAQPALRADAIQLASNSTPQQVGTQVAQSVYGGIGQSDRVTR